MCRTFYLLSSGFCCIACCMLLLQSMLPIIVVLQVPGGAGGPNAVDGVAGAVSGDVQTQELAAKIAENEQLHLKVRYEPMCH